jgi:hypothetical protein
MVNKLLALAITIYEELGELYCSNIAAMHSILFHVFVLFSRYRHLGALCTFRRGLGRWHLTFHLGFFPHSTCASISCFSAHVLHQDTAFAI